MGEFKEFFGVAAPFVGGALLFAFIGLAIWAVLNGREVSVWPPRIGAKPVDPVSGGLGVAAEPPDTLNRQFAAAQLDIGTDQPVVAQAKPSLFDKEFAASEAKSFYDHIAGNYDLRNSSDLLKTHQAVVTQIRSHLKRKTNFKVLDLGGGTGKQIATQFFHKSNMHWTYSDFSLSMSSAFQANLAGTKLGKNNRLIFGDIAEVPLQVRDEEFDIILFSLVLSSMPASPDFRPFAGLLKPGGRLIVADINPVYTALNPYYAVLVDGEKFALRTNPVNPLSIAQHAADLGLSQLELCGIGDGEQSYSFLAVFERPVA
ncbi:class I SAM-dependent methyltransferase [Nocardioides plantarum]|uniref:Class I SAM-dependent methyltransferase n=1 Tax=Nocardioides plantarum TaxID=29299 RepID=A0ABV5KIL9_9ACTN|nr:methyltransferase domain-containing protein [Nocardioides plantarum]